MNILAAALLSLGLVLASAAPSTAQSPAVTEPPAVAEPAPIPPADVGPPLAGSEGGGLGLTEIVIATVVIGGAFAIGLATEGGLAAAITGAAAVLLIYNMQP